MTASDAPLAGKIPTDGRARIRAFAVAVLGAAGLALYLWPAVAAPVVLWSDSAFDLEWARTGAGLLRPPAAADVALHPIKPGYVAFLAAATRAIPGVSPERSAVVVQSILLFGSIAATAVFLARRRGFRCGLLLFVFLIAFLRLRDGASAVMTEALAAALFLPLAAAALELPRSDRGAIAAGIAASALFAVRPNLAAVAAVLFAASLLLAGRVRALAKFTAAAALLTGTFWFVTRGNAGPDPLRGIGYPVLEGSLEYYWRPSLGPWPPAASSPPPTARGEIGAAKERWRAALSRSGPDARRELTWRALHGIFGVEYYDPRWSAVYRALDVAARRLSPFLIIAGIAAAGEGVRRRPDRAGAILAALFVLLLVGHDLVLGPNPRYLLPALPLFLVFLARALSAPAHDGRPERRARPAVPALASVLLVAALLSQRHVLDWQWGRIEREGIAILQRIPRGAIPPGGNSTLHVRMGSPEPARGARFRVEGPGGEVLQAIGPDPTRAFAVFAVPPALAERNQRAAVEMRIVSEGAFSPVSYLLFPVVPPPWGPSAHRADGPSLSPTTGVDAGGLDWWVHRGAP